MGWRWCSARLAGQRRLGALHGRCSAEFAVAHADALVVGPGLGRSDETRTRVRSVSLRKPIVLDADGLRAVAGDLASLTAPRRLVLRAALGRNWRRLARRHGREVGCDRFGALRRLAQESSAIVLLKRPRTLISRARRTGLLVSAFRNSALATAGQRQACWLASSRVAFGRATALPPRTASRPARASGRCSLCRPLPAEPLVEAGGDAVLATDPDQATARGPCTRLL